MVFRKILISQFLVVSKYYRLSILENVEKYKLKWNLSKKGLLLFEPLFHFKWNLKEG